jgi:hypothetical protein
MTDDPEAAGRWHLGRTRGPTQPGCLLPHAPLSPAAALAFSHLESQRPIYHPGRLLLHRRQDMRLDVQGHADFGVPQPLLDHLRMKPSV